MTCWKSVCLLSFSFVFPVSITSILSFAFPSLLTLLTMAILHIPCTCHGVGGVTDWLGFRLPLYFLMIDL